VGVSLPHLQYLSLTKGAAKMPAYMIAMREGPVRDSQAMAEYQARAGAIPGNWHLVPRVVYGAVEALEGKAPDGVVILEFPTMDEAKAWYNSPAYQEALPFRLKAGNYTTFFVEGLG